ncbi:hypothetical protein HPG69_008683, partial [Diceros bicornis minor]
KLCEENPSHNVFFPPLSPLLWSCSSWGQKETQLPKSPEASAAEGGGDFKESCQKFYQAELEGLSFAEAAEVSRQHTNACMAERTEDRIVEVLPANSIDLLTELVLINAIYFKGRPWVRTVSFCSCMIKERKEERREGERKREGERVENELMYEKLSKWTKSGTMDNEEN